MPEDADSLALRDEDVARQAEEREEVLIYRRPARNMSWSYRVASAPEGNEIPAGGRSRSIM